MKLALKKAVRGIEEAGFSHMKVELEGQLNRRVDARCPTCKGNGRQTCLSCEATGYIPSKRGDPVECESCTGDTFIRCNGCNGQGRVDAIYSSESRCQNFILDYVCQELYGISYEERQRKVKISGFQAIDGLTYARFYYDGSVDSEITFTVPVTAVEMVPVFIRAFKALAKATGHKMDVQGSGMHIGVLPAADKGVYPGRTNLNPRKLSNFQREVTKLLPALFFCASAGHQSRGLNYRNPQISTESKYSAIYARQGRMLEYRVFETCYDRPEVFYDFVQVIANTLRFYADPTLKIKELGHDFPFPSGNQVSRFFRTVDQLKIINATVKHIKPEDKSYKQMKQERGVTGTVANLIKTEKITVQKLKEDYKQIKKHYDEVIKQPLTDDERANVDRLMILEGYSHERAVAYVRNTSPLVPMMEFIQRNTRRQSVSGTTVRV